MVWKDSFFHTIFFWREYQNLYLNFTILLESIVDFHDFSPFAYIKNEFEKNKRDIIISVIVLLIFGGGWYYFKVYRVQVQESAHSALTETFQEIPAALENPEKWNDVEVAAKTGYRQNSSSTLAPYFLGVESQALAQQNDLSQAIQTLTKAIKSLDSGSPFYYHYKISLARMKLDTDDKITEGENELFALAEDAENPYQDKALYYVGMYFITKNTLAEAKKKFEQIISLKDKFKNSPWVDLAQEQLERLG